jgi:two-component system, OmpR family, phosphate regulon sensor histidine kinase PhoR
VKLGIRGKLFGLSIAFLAAIFVVVYTYLHNGARYDVGLSEAESKAVLEWVDRGLGVALILSIASAFAISSAAARIASRAASALAESARKTAEGDVRQSPGLHAEDEFGELGAALDQLARGYADALADYSRERDRMRGILSGMREGVLLLDRRRRVSLVNPTLREMLLLGADVEGRSPLEVIRHAEIVRLLDEAQAEDEPASGEIEIGGLKPRRLMVQVVRIPGEEGGLLAVFVDVTHLRRLESMRKDFVANASHELRTPVATIHSAAETLAAVVTRDPNAAGEFVDIIMRNAQRLKNLVDDLLDLSRIESQDFHVWLEPLDAGQTFAVVAELFRERAATKGIRLVLDASVRQTVLADRRGLERVLSNLVDNAVKYCGQGTTVTCAAEARSDKAAALSVTDDGPGIEGQHLPRLFERFYRVDPGRSRELGGTGLGLSIVKHLVEAMGGRIGVSSEPGKGTRFEIVLSAAQLGSLPARVTNPPPAA